RRQGARDRPQPDRGDLRHILARARRRDSVIARIHRHLSVDRRRGAGLARRAGRASARVHDSHAGDVVRPDDSRRRRGDRAPGRPRKTDSRARPDSALEATTWGADTLTEMISVVVPLLNEEQSLETLYRETVEALDALRNEFEVVFVDDGS